MSEDNTAINVLDIGGILFYRHTVIGRVEETGNLVTVGGFITDTGDTIRQLKELSEGLGDRCALLADTLQLLIDEVKACTGEDSDRNPILNDALSMAAHALYGQPSQPPVESACKGEAD